MPFRFSLFLILTFTTLIGCSSSRSMRGDYYSTASSGSLAKTAQYNADILPLCDGQTDCDGFILEIENISDAPLEIDWERTQYYKRGQTTGIFLRGGGKYSEKDTPSPVSIIVPGTVHRYALTPSANIYWERGTKQKVGGYREAVFLQGEHGVFLTVVTNAGRSASLLVLDFKEADRDTAMSLDEKTGLPIVKHTPAKVWEKTAAPARTDLAEPDIQ